jgi:hypothetical protein
VPEGHTDRRSWPPDQGLRTIWPPSCGRFGPCSSLLRICCCAMWQGPRLRRRDRVFMAAISSALLELSSFLVSPQTLLRSHRELVRRKWTYRRRSGGRPSITGEVREHILRMGRAARRWSGPLQGCHARISCRSGPVVDAEAAPPPAAPSLVPALVRLGPHRLTGCGDRK